MDLEQSSNRKWSIVSTALERILMMKQNILVFEIWKHPVDNLQIWPTTQFPQPTLTRFF